MFIRNEDFRSFLRFYPIVSTLVIIHLLLWLIPTFFPGGQLVLQFGIGFNLAVEAGEYWRLITPILLHGSFGHMLFNSFSLVLFGPALEQMLGKSKFLFVYFCSGIGANIATYFLAPSQYTHLGASGAIFGLFGVYLYMVLYRKDLIDQSNAQIIVVILIIGLIMTFARANINIYGHLFGFLSGLALAPIILKKVYNRYYQQRFRDFDDTSISFNPDRWTKAAKRKKQFKKLLWIVIILLVGLGIFARFL